MNLNFFCLSPNSFKKVGALRKTGAKGSACLRGSGLSKAGHSLLADAGVQLLSHPETPGRAS